MMNVTKNIEIKGFLQTVRHEMISRFFDRAAFAKFRAIRHQQIADIES
jgi:hypothetical protein